MGSLSLKSVNENSLSERRKSNGAKILGILVLKMMHLNHHLKGSDLLLEPVNFLVVVSFLKNDILSRIFVLLISLDIICTTIFHNLQTFFAEFWLVKYYINLVSYPIYLFCMLDHIVYHPRQSTICRLEFSQKTPSGSWQSSISALCGTGVSYSYISHLLIIAWSFSLQHADGFSSAYHIH